MSEEFEFRTGRSCVFKNIIHLVFITKYRRGVFSPKMLDRTKEIIKETCEQMDVELLEFGGEDDHIHLMVCCPPKLAIARLVGKLKGKSSYFLRKEYWKDIKHKLWGTHFWSPSYCVVSCGESPLQIVKQYVANQRKPAIEKNVNQSKKLAGRKRDKDKKL